MAHAIRPPALPFFLHSHSSCTAHEWTDVPPLASPPASARLSARRHVSCVMCHVGHVGHGSWVMGSWVMGHRLCLICACCIPKERSSMSMYLLLGRSIRRSIRGRYLHKRTIRTVFTVLVPLDAQTLGGLDRARHSAA